MTKERGMLELKDITKKFHVFPFTANPPQHPRCGEIGLPP
jgi:hypothetical protein